MSNFFSKKEERPPPRHRSSRQESDSSLDEDISEFYPSSIIEELKEQLRKCLSIISKINNAPPKWKDIIGTRLKWLEEDEAKLNEKWKKYKLSNQSQTNYKGMPTIAQIASPINAVA